VTERYFIPVPKSPAVAVQSGRHAIRICSDPTGTGVSNHRNSGWCGSAAGDDREPSGSVADVTERNHAFLTQLGVIRVGYGSGPYSADRTKIKIGMISSRPTHIFRRIISLDTSGGV
jgi:hypothetical protein